MQQKSQSWFQNNKKVNLVDWNCRLHLQMCSHWNSPQQICNQLSAMYTKFGFTNFSLLCDYCHTSESVSAFLIRLERMEKELRSYLPTPLHIRLQASVLLTPNLCDVVDIHRLCLRHNGYLPILLPLSSYADWIDKELNHLLYHRGILPLFLSFERAIRLYPQEITEKLLRIPRAAFQFAYHDLQNENVAQAVTALLRQNTSIFLGTGLTQAPKIDTYDFPNWEECVNPLLSHDDMATLLRENRMHWSRSSIHTTL